MKKPSNTSTTSLDFALDVALAKVPKTFRPKIISNYCEIKRHRLAAAYKPLGMSAAHFVESVLRLVQQEVNGAHIPFGKSVNNFAGECRKVVESNNTNVPEDSLRLVIPRALVYVYTIRNKRGVGHVGGDVDANKIDAEAIAGTCDWIICELIRVFHGMSLEEAQDIVNTLAERQIPDVWHVGEKKRVLRPGLSAKQQVLLLCYQEGTSTILSEDLCEWIEYSNASVFKRKVLKPLHVERLIEYDQSTESVTISPSGNKLVEQTILGS